MPLSSWDTGVQNFNEWKSQNSILSLLMVIFIVRNLNIFQKRIEISCITDFDIFSTNFSPLPYSPECPSVPILRQVEVILTTSGKSQKIQKANNSPWGDHGRCKKSNSFSSLSFVNRDVKGVSNLVKRSNIAAPLILFVTSPSQNKGELSRATKATSQLEMSIAIPLE